MKFLLYLLPVCAIMQAAPKANLFELRTNSSSHQDQHFSPDYLSKSFFRFGDQLITLEKYDQGAERSYLLVSLHSNETQAIQNTMSFARSHNAVFYKLGNQNRRNVEANLLDKKISFDPYRIFTGMGRKINLKLNRCFDRATSNRVQQFAHFLTGEMDPYKTLVSVHNTDEHPISFTDYKKGGKMEKQAGEVHQNDLLDVKDFFLTNEESIYHQLKARNFNVVLQPRGKMKDDGSLGLYCSKSNKPYVAIETKADHKKEQQEMLTAIDQILN